MKDSWNTMKLANVATCLIGLTYKPTDVVDEGGTIVLRSSNIQDNKIALNDIVRVRCDINPSKYVKDGDILMCSRNGSFRLVGKVAKINKLDETMSFGAFMTIIRSEYNDYLFYFFQSQSFRKQIFVGQTATINQITTKMLNNTYVNIPPLSEQQLIVEELDLLRFIIEKKKSQLNELDSLAQSLFYEMFGDPITNEKGWEIKKIGEIASFYNGKAHENVIDEEGKYIVVNAKYISSNGEIIKKTNKQLFPLYTNDIVMVMSDVPNGKALARCSLITSDNSYSLNQRICAFREYKQNPIYLLFVLNRNSYYLGFNDGNGQTNLRKNEVINCPVPLPPLALQQQFASKIETIEHQKELIKQSINEVETLFNSRMDYYFN